MGISLLMKFKKR